MWPPLPTKGFITGRTATKEDIANGNAAFFLAGDGVAAMRIEIPQYAYHIDDKTGMQAERTSDGKELLAMQQVEGGGKMIGLFAEFKLLGKLPPKVD